MSFAAAHNTIRTRFKALVEDVVTGLADKVAYDNAPFTKPDDTAWVRCNILDGQSFQAEFGSQKTHRNPGVLIAQVFTPLQQGDKQSLEISDVIVASFRSVTVSGVTFQTPSIVTVGRNENEWQVNVSCPFFFDDIV